MEETELLHAFSEELRELLNPNAVEDAKLVQKGLILYRQGLVQQVTIEDRTVTAVVQDVTPVKVLLDLDFAGLSECSCPTEGLCRHQLAVFFSAFSKVSSVSDWVSDWREPIREQKSAAGWGMQTAKDLIKANGVLQPDYGRWVHSFEVSFDTLLASKQHTSPYVIPELFGIYERRLHASAPVEQEWRLLYELVGIVVSFRKLAALSERLGHDEATVKRAYLHVFHNLMEDTEELAVKIGVQSLPFAFDEFIERLKDDAYALLTCASGLEYERIYLYRLLWVHFFKKKPWREEELLKIHAGLKGLQDWENPLPLMAAGVHLNLLVGDDERALELVGLFSAAEIAPYMVYWIDYLSGLKAWRRVGPVIELFLQKVKPYLEALAGYHSCAAFVRNALRAVAPYCAESDRLDVYERALLAMLPYSFGEYEYLLFERGQFDRWGELQAFVGLDFYELPKERLKAVEKEQPEVLLAMLHQTAQREIDQKNRASYRMAVRHLKKLRTLYKKLKRVDDWQYFLDTLMERTKRLRAFHEECRRSKLIEG
ncbi:zinc finger SWIM domain-containing protein [Neobacillus bataviensis LMG 21833]|uniref:Zinc finger SWIM domain-containing protein n=1 Tax=Neobacillus bataviensis LMG 21833 TaxID=1117379 RepID=K6DDY4_9BACI|nr:SWIM zinc finger family protein [Neobacillus bataviensis]EKN66484.1 zinc finger SWIM domain-containing protein [Neobacillus bataviensis LMG 21833]